MSERAALTKTSENKVKNPVGAKPKENYYESMDSPVEQIFHLQRTIGNQAVQRLIKSGTIQAKLKIGQPNDKYEQEADRVADKVMIMPEPDIQRQPEEEKEEIQTKPLADQIAPLVQRQADEEEELLQTKLLYRQENEEEPVQSKLQRQPEEEEEEPIQAKPALNQTPAVPSNIESSINSLKGGGQPLPESTRAYFEPRFGRDFSQVRVHTDSNASNTAQSINAKAFTTGKDLVFGVGQYSPETSSGKQLLAHELTHTVQQGKSKTGNLQRQEDVFFIQRNEDLRSRAEKEKEAGDSELSDALNLALMKTLNFSFRRGFDGSTIFKIQQGGELHIRVKSNYDDNSKGSEEYIISLINSDTGKSAGDVNFPIGTNYYTYSWKNLDRGDYYLKFKRKVESEKMISGTIWAEVISGPGIVGYTGNKDEEFELTTGTKTTATSAQGLAFGEYVLRSEPVKQSYIFGTLPKDPKGVRVTVIDKKSFDREGKDTWYKIEFQPPEEFLKHAISVPPPNFTNAKKAYDNRYAWVTGDAMKVYIPYEDFIKFIKAYETDSEISKLSLKARITKLRQLYAEEKLEADHVIGTDPGNKKVEDRPSLSGLYQMLKKSDTGIILPNGELVDAGHIILSLDAYNFPDRNVSMYSLPAGTSHALSTWSGDIGGAVADYMMEHLEEGKTGLDTKLLDKHFSKSATDDDLLGNLDGICSSYLLTLTPEVKSIEELLTLYFKKSGTFKTSDLKSRRADALTYLLTSYGFRSPKGLKSQTVGFNSIYLETERFGWIWFLERIGIGGILGKSLTFQHKKIHDLLYNVSHEMATKFLEKMESFAQTFGLTKFKFQGPKSVISP